MKFKRLTDRAQIDLAKYLKTYIEQVGAENVRLYIGCDSQNKSAWTNYATTIVIHIGNTGCHVLYQKERVRPRIEDFWTRLWKEVERSVEVALYLQENGIEVDNIDLDLNDDPNMKSNKLVAAARGYVESLGIKANIKPDLLPAICAADHIVK
jgi:predicted RNase H-related nuclease YkuK (DUF458 family)